MKISKSTFWEIRAAADNADIGEVLIYGPIANDSWWGDEVTPKQFKADLDALGEVGKINVYINSPGGDVFASQAILTMLKRHSASVEVHIDGLAASGASIIAMAGETIHMPKNAMMMIHNPWTYASGNAADFRDVADRLDKIGETLVAAYQEKTGLEAEKIVGLLGAETWMTAQEAYDYGFVDVIEEAKPIAASFDQDIMAHYRNIPEDLQLVAKEPMPVMTDAERQEERAKSRANLEATTQVLRSL